jgi:hypothetical protein
MRGETPEFMRVLQKAHPPRDFFVVALHGTGRDDGSAGYTITYGARGGTPLAHASRDSLRRAVYFSTRADARDGDGDWLSTPTDPNTADYGQRYLTLSDDYDVVISMTSPKATTQVGTSQPARCCTPIRVRTRAPAPSHASATGRGTKRLRH